MYMLFGSNSADFAKDTYYRFMKVIHINWNRFTSMLATNISKTDGTTFLYRDEYISLKDIYKKNRKRRGRSKYLLSVVVEAEKDNHKFLSRLYM